MVKPRIHGIAKEMNVSKTEVLDLLVKFGFKTKNHMSTLEENELNLILEHFTQKNQVEEFTFILEKLQKHAEQGSEPEVSIDDSLEDLNKPIEKKSRYVVTRTSKVNLEKFDKEKIDDYYLII